MEVLQEYHSKFPARAGIPRVELTNKLKLGKYAPLFIDRLISDKTLVEVGAVLRMSEFKVKLTAAQQAKIDAFLKATTAQLYSPPSELIPEPDLLALLIDSKQVVKLAEGVVISKKAYDEMVNKVMAQLSARGKITLAEVRDMFQTSRKYAQALLEHLDGQKVTRRVGDERVKY